MNSPRPTAWAQMTLTSINAHIRIGRATVLPGDLVLVKTDEVIFIPAMLAEPTIISAELTNLEEVFNFELNRQGKNGAESKEVGPRPNMMRWPSGSTSPRTS
jgi:4-hydroxy-4-methyl-2-oxoglutarate aldolase